MNKYLVRNFKWIENLGKVPAKVYRLDLYDVTAGSLQYFQDNLANMAAFMASAFSPGWKNSKFRRCMPFKIPAPILQISNSALAILFSTWRVCAEVINYALTLICRLCPDNRKTLKGN